MDTDEEYDGPPMDRRFSPMRDSGPERLGQDKPGYVGTEYDLVPYDSGLGLYDTFLRRYNLFHSVPLSFSQNKYEMFAFGASSIVAAVGGVDDMAGLEGVFSGYRDLRDLKKPGGTTMWSPLNTGHSAQFVHSYLDVKAYWQALLEDIDAQS